MSTLTKNKPWQEKLSVKFRKLLSGASDGIPPWLPVVAEGDEPGLFLPGDAPWVVHRDFATLVGGIRALLMQALHPGSLAGVAQHSRYEQDPLGRLSGTIRWLTVTTFGSHAAVAGEASRVNRLHERVAGSYESTSGSKPYRAADPDLLTWVHVAFTDSFLSAHNTYCKNKADADAYVEQWGRSVAQLGLTRVSTSLAELDQAVADFAPELRADETTLRVVSFIRRPPLPLLVRPVYRLLWLAAVYSLRDEHRELLGLKKPGRWVVGVTRFVLVSIRVLIGPESPIEDGALARLQRIGLLGLK